MGEVLKDEEARKELFGFAKLEGNSLDIEYSLKRLFEDNINPMTRKKSAIVSSFQKNGKNFRLADSNTNVDELISFIIDNDIEVIAPYLARNFDADKINDLTVSWWTQEMENEGLKIDPNWSGETPAFKIDFSKTHDLNDLISSLGNKSSEDLLMVADEYAKVNPTIVFGAFEDDLYNLNSNPKKENSANLSLINVVPINAGINCSTVLPNDIIRYNMPEFRILDNTRSWPNGNWISIWVAYGAYTNSSDGFPTMNFNINRISNEQKIDRGDFSWKTNFFIPLITQWDPTNHSIQIIVAHKKTNITLTSIGTSVAVNPTTGISASRSLTFSVSHTRAYGSNTWVRCAEINGAHTLPVSPSNQLRNGNAIWQLQSPEGRCQFTLEPRLSRL